MLDPTLMRRIRFCSCVSMSTLLLDTPDASVVLLSSEISIETGVGCRSTSVSPVVDVVITVPVHTNTA